MYTPGWPKRARPVYHFHTAILAVNCQINHEASQILQENHFVKLTTNDAIHEMEFCQSLVVVAESELASRVTYSLIDLNLIPDRKSPGIYPSVIMFAGDDMSTFCRFLLRLGLDFHCSLSIAISDTAPVTTSTLKLLEPFRRLHSLNSVRIAGHVSDEFKSDLIAKMMNKAPEIHTILGDIQRNLERGDQAVSNNDYFTAKEIYKRALEENDDRDYLIHKSSKTILMDDLEAAFSDNRFALSTKLAVTYLKTENHSRAHEWITWALWEIGHYGRVAGDPPGGAEAANLYSIAAQASEGLGLVGRAVEELNEAVWHDPEDLELTTELVRLKTKVQSGDGELESIVGGMSVGCIGQAGQQGAQTPVA